MQTGGVKPLFIKRAFPKAREPEEENGFHGDSPFSVGGQNEAFRNFDGSVAQFHADDLESRFCVRDKVESRSNALLPHTSILPRFHPFRAGQVATTTSRWKTRRRFCRTTIAAFVPDRVVYRRHRSRAGWSVSGHGQNQRSRLVEQNRDRSTSVRGSS